MSDHMLARYLRGADDEQRRKLWHNLKRTLVGDAQTTINAMCFSAPLSEREGEREAARDATRNGGRASGASSPNVLESPSRSDKSQENGSGTGGDDDLVREMDIEHAHDEALKLLELIPDRQAGLTSSP